MASGTTATIFNTTKKYDRPIKANDLLVSDDDSVIIYVTHVNVDKHKFSGVVVHAYDSAPEFVGQSVKDYKQEKYNLFDGYVEILQDVDEDE